MLGQHSQSRGARPCTAAGRHSCVHVCDSSARACYAPKAPPDSSLRTRSRAVHLCCCTGQHESMLWGLYSSRQLEHLTRSAETTVASRLSTRIGPRRQITLIMALRGLLQAREVSSLLRAAWSLDVPDLLARCAICARPRFRDLLAAGFSTRSRRESNGLRGVNGACYAVLPPCSGLH
jgi:hypothetical protein